MSNDQKKRGLGRGLAALLVNTSGEEQTGSAKEFAPDQGGRLTPQAAALAASYVLSATA